MVCPNLRPSDKLAPHIVNSGQLLHFATPTPPRPAHQNISEHGSSSKTEGAPPPRFTSGQTNFRWSYMRLRPTCNFISHSYAELWRMLNSNLNKGGLIAIKLAPSQERSGAEPAKLVELTHMLPGWGCMRRATPSWGRVHEVPESS